LNVRKSNHSFHRLDFSQAVELFQLFMVNFISHLLGVFEQFNKDSRLNPTHVSLYMALFQLWNLYRFQETFSIHRGEVMEMGKIGSRDTYHKCLKNLHDWRYIHYLPSHNPYKGSRIKMLVFRTTSGQPGDKDQTSTERVLVPKTNNIKKDKKNNRHSKPENEDVVKDLFLANRGSLKDAELFFNHYEANGWMIGISKIKNWKAAAKSWILKADSFKAKETSNKPVFQDYLKVKSDKDYDEPL
jgi:hypothetical protein